MLCQQLVVIGSTIEHEHKHGGTRSSIVCRPVRHLQYK